MRNIALTAVLLFLLALGAGYYFRASLPPLFTLNEHEDEKEIADNKPTLYDRNQQGLDWHAQTRQNQYYYGNQVNYQNYQYGGQSGNRPYYHYHNSDSYYQGGAGRVLQSPPPY